MHINFRHYWLILTLLLTGHLLPASSFAAPTLVALGDSFCPYNCTPDAAQRGYMVELLEKVLKPQWTVNYRLEPWARAVSQVESGEAHILVATAADTGRNLRTSDIVGVDRSCFFVRTDNPWRYTTVKDLAGLRLSVIQDYSYDNSGPVDTLIDGYRTAKDPRLEISYGKDALNSSLQKLMAGRADAIIENENVARYRIKKSGLDKKLRLAGCLNHYVGTLHFGVTRALPESAMLIEQINRGLKALRDNGEIKQVLGRYGVSDWQP